MEKVHIDMEALPRTVFRADRIQVKYFWEESEGECEQRSRSEEEYPVFFKLRRKYGRKKGATLGHGDLASCPLYPVSREFVNYLSELS